MERGAQGSIADVVTAASLQLAAALDDNLDEVIDQTLEAIATHEGADRAHITKYLGDGRFTNSHEWVASGLVSHRPALALRRLEEFPFSVTKVFSGEVWHAADLSLETDEAAPEKASFGAFGVKSVLQVPIRIGGTTVGCIGFNHMQSTRSWSPEAIDLVRRVGDAIGMALARRDATIALRAARDDAERANRAKDEFLSRVSHELRTPLNAVLGFTELLMVDEDRPDRRAKLDQVLTSGQELLHLVDEILDASRLASGRLDLAVEEVPLAEAVLRAEQAVTSLAADHGVVVEVAPVDRRTRVLADPQRLHQCLVHVLDNAVTYNRPGGRVWLTVEVEAHRARIVVRDDGLGMSADRLAQVFEPFERLGAERRNAQGSGMGLPLSRMLLETMNGSIDLVSEIGVGTTVTIELQEVGPSSAQVAMP